MTALLRTGSFLRGWTTQFLGTDKVLPDGPSQPVGSPGRISLDQRRRSRQIEFISHIKWTNSAQGLQLEHPSSAKKALWALEIPRKSKPGMANPLSFDLDPIPPLLTVKQVAQIMQWNPFTVIKKAEKGELPGFKLGRSWRFRKQDILAWIEQQRNSR